MKILRVAMTGEEHPNYTLHKAFTDAFGEVDTFWWQNHDTHVINAHLQNVVGKNNYDVVFMQIQADGVIWEDTARIMSEHALVLNWTGDVREDLTAYTRIGRYCVTLMCSDTDVKRMRAMGYRAEYLPAGYDHKYYYNQMRMHRERKIVFCANNYRNTKFPLSDYRLHCAATLQAEFGTDFKLYGAGWEGTGVVSEGVLDNVGEANAYNGNLIVVSISHFHHDRYFSDRLLRAMACGAFVLSHNYPEIGLDFIEGKHLQTFCDVNELVRKARHYLGGDFHIQNEVRMVGDAGSRWVSSHFQWEMRMHDIRDFILKYKS